MSAETLSMVEGAIAVADMQVSDVMVPRVDVVGIDHETPWSEVVDRVRSSEHARFPVYADTIDDPDVAWFAACATTLITAIDWLERCQNFEDELFLTTAQAVILDIGSNRQDLSIIFHDDR